MSTNSLTYDNFSLLMRHVITTEGDVSLAELFGVSPDDPLFTRLLQGPQGLADTLLREINTSVTSAVLVSAVVGKVSCVLGHV